MSFKMQTAQKYAFKSNLFAEPPLNFNRIIQTLWHYCVWQALLISRVSDNLATEAIWNMPKYWATLTFQDIYILNFINQPNLKWQYSENPGSQNIEHVTHRCLIDVTTDHTDHNSLRWIKKVDLIDLGGGDITNSIFCLVLSLKKNLTVKMVGIAESDDRGHKILHSLGLSYESL